MVQQLPLDFKFLDNITFADFLSGNNQQLLFNLQSFLDFNTNNQDFFYIWGKKQVGKTHLLQACCNNALSKNIQAMYLSFNNIKNLTINNNYEIDIFFSGLDKVPLLCLDDIHLGLQQHHYVEEKLFYLFNNIRANNNKLIVTANLPPNNLNLSLPDLQSRLSWGMVYHLQELNEQEKITALILRSERIGLQLTEKVAKFLLFRIPRNTGQLFKILEQLDLAALIATKRKLTIPFIRKILKI